MSEPKSREDLQALLSAYAENDLNEVDRRDVHRALLDDAELRAEYEDIKATMGLLRELPDPDGADDLALRMAERVRSQLQKEQVPAAVDDDVAHDVPFLSAPGLDTGLPNDPTHAGQVPPTTRGRIWEFAFAACAVCALVVGVAFVNVDGTPSTNGVNAAGVGEAHVVTSDLDVDLPQTQVERVLRDAKLQVLSSSTTKVVAEGPGASALHAVVQLRRQGKVQGLNPAADGTVRLVLRLK